MFEAKAIGSVHKFNETFNFEITVEATGSVGCPESCGFPTPPRSPAASALSHTSTVSAVFG